MTEDTAPVAGKNSTRLDSLRLAPNRPTRPDSTHTIIGRRKQKCRKTCPSMGGKLGQGDPWSLPWWALQEAISKDTISAKFQCPPPNNVCLAASHSFLPSHSSWLSWMRAIPATHSLARSRTLTHSLTYASYFFARRTNRLAVLSNVKGSLVLLFYQSNKLEMFAMPPGSDAPKRQTWLKHKVHRKK